MDFKIFLKELDIKDMDDYEGFTNWKIDKESIRKLLLEKSKTKRIVVWGASSGGAKTIELLSSIGVKPKFLVDSDKEKQNKEIFGLPVYSPDVLSESDFVVIGSSSYQVEISRWLENNKIDYLGNMGLLLCTGITTQYPQKISIFNYKLKELLSVFSLFEDIQSKHVFISYIKYLISSFPSFLKIANYDQYIHPIVKPEKGDIVVDAGAFDGDTAYKFLKIEPNLKRIYSFEPENENYLKLEKKFKDSKKVTCVKMGLWKEPKELSFNKNLGMASHIDENNKSKQKIIVTTLCNFFKNKEFPDLIKMDIEGSELDALMGTTEILRIKKPKLQICIYHKPEHLYEIPLFIKKINSNYHFYLGHHSNGLGELVLYAL